MKEQQHEHRNRTHPGPPDAARRSAPNGRSSPIPMSRLVTVELRKMFDTRAGFWLMASVGIVAVLATAAVILWAPDSAIDQETFSTAIGMPLSVVLPIIASLSVTSEYSQRTGLTTYTLVPWRGRVITAKMIVTLAIGVASMFLALAVGAVGNLLGSAITGLDPVWNITLEKFGQIVLANVLGMLIGFMLGVLFRSSAAAIVGYFVYSLVLPVALGSAGRLPGVVPRPAAVGRRQLRHHPALRPDDDRRVLAAAGRHDAGVALDPAGPRAARGPACRGEVDPLLTSCTSAAAGRGTGGR